MFDRDDYRALYRALHDLLVAHRPNDFSYLEERHPRPGKL